MLAFVYDGKATLVYMNGDLVAESEIRDGEYGLTGFWIGGSNEYVREVRFWDISPHSTANQGIHLEDGKSGRKRIAALLPCNGQKRDHETGAITNDENKVWNWATYYNGDKSKLDLPFPTSGKFDDNDGKMFVFPAE